MTRAGFVLLSAAGGAGVGVFAVLVSSIALALHGGLDQLGTALFAFMFVGLGVLGPALAAGGAAGAVAALVALLPLRPIVARVLHVAVLTAGLIAVTAVLVERFRAGPVPVVLCGILAVLIAGAVAVLLPPRRGDPTT